MGSNVVEWVLRLVNQVSGPAAAASVSTRAMVPAANAASVGFGKLGAAMGPIGGILSRIDPQLGAVASSVAGLTSASSTAAAGLGVSAGVMGVALAAVVAAASPFIGALVVMQRESDEAAARMAFLTAHAHDLESATRGLTDAQIAQAVATGALTEAQGKLATLEEARDRAVQDFALSHEKERQAAEASIDTMERQQHYLGLFPEFLSVAVDHYAGFTSAGREAMGVIEGLNALEAEHTGVVYETTDARKAEAEATEKARKAEERKEKADRIAIDNAKKHADAIKAQTAAYEEWQAKYNEEKKGEAGEEAAEAGAEVLAIMVEIAEMRKEAAAADKEWAETSANAAAEARRAQEAAMFEGANSAMSAFSNPLGVVASSSPWGAMIVGLMDMVSHLGDTLDGFANFGDEFVAGMKNAPRDIVEFIIGQLRDGDPIIDMLKMAEELVTGFVKGIPDMMEAMVGDIGLVAGAFVEHLILSGPKIAIAFFGTLFDPETWIGVVKSFVEGLVEGFKRFGESFSETASTGGSQDAPPPRTGTFADYFMDAPTSHADGADYVDKTGLYMLHRGERVDTASRTQREAGNSSSGSGSGRMVGRGGKVYIEIDADSLSDTFGGLRGRGYAL